MLVFRCQIPRVVFVWSTWIPCFLSRDMELAAAGIVSQFPVITASRGQSTAGSTVLFIALSEARFTTHHPVVDSTENVNLVYKFECLQLALLPLFPVCFLFLLQPVSTILLERDHNYKSAVNGVLRQLTS